ncbi:hypothetical protein [Psychromonas antarctica]|uniref:hypothetical protein n=1 Tax=Psychromonas antarctica TaxID=67573 RepID=UPI001EE7C9BA|nr:hypothetical protein [Psychromonas antarctica]MCG6202813.1 hypothetical protein [Psychromonas antarctica]
MWDSLPESTRTIFCRASQLKTGHINLPLHEFNETDRAQLLKSIKSINSVAQEMNRLAGIPLHHFK